jgi:hypothetical protein
MGEQFVGEADHLQLAQLVTEIAWRIDHGKADTVHELFVDEGPGTTVPGAVGEDHDRFVRTDQGWRFVSRSFDLLFVRQDA